MPDNNQSGLQTALAAIPVVGGIANAFIQGGQNKKTREWNEKMYAIQRKDYLADYMMQNLYNSPIEQMKRLKAAGLNPNLVYGTGAVGNNASPVKSASVEAWNPKAPQIDTAAITGGILSYYDARLKQAQIDNVQAQTDVAHEQKWKTIAETLNVHQNTKSSEFDLGLKEHLRDTTILAAEKGVEKTIAETGRITAETALAITENDVKQAMKQPNIDKVMAEIINIKKDTILKGAQTEVQRKEAALKAEELAKLYQEIHNLYINGKLAEFDLALKEIRGRGSDYPGWIKPGYDLITDLINRLIPSKKKNP